MYGRPTHSLSARSCCCCHVSRFLSTCLIRVLLWVGACLRLGGCGGVWADSDVRCDPTHGSCGAWWSPGTCCGFRWVTFFLLRTTRRVVWNVTSCFFFTAVFFLDPCVDRRSRCRGLVWLLRSNAMSSQMFVVPNIVSIFCGRVRLALGLSTMRSIGFVGVSCVTEKAKRALATWPRSV